MSNNFEELVVRYADTGGPLLHERLEAETPGLLSRKFAAAIPHFVRWLLSSVTAREALWCERHTLMPVLNESSGFGHRVDSLMNNASRQLSTEIAEPHEHPWFEGYHQRKLESELLYHYGLTPAPSVLAELEAVEARYGGTGELQLPHEEYSGLLRTVQEAMRVMESASLANPHEESADILREVLRMCRATELMSVYSRALTGYQNLSDAVNRARLSLVAKEEGALGSHFRYLEVRDHYSNRGKRLATNYDFNLRLTRARWEFDYEEAHADYSRELDEALELLPKSVERAISSFELKEARREREEERERKREMKAARKRERRARRERKRAERRGESLPEERSEPELMERGEGSYDYRGDFEPGAMTLDPTDPLVKLMLSGEVVTGERTEDGWQVQVQKPRDEHDGQR